MTSRASHRTTGRSRAVLVLFFVLAAATLGPAAPAHTHLDGLEVGSCTACATSATPAASAPGTCAPLALHPGEALPGIAPTLRPCETPRHRAARAPPSDTFDH